MTVKPIIIAGPTASGKSSLAMDLAKRFGGALLCADSRQFYSGMVIGTAGPSEKERAEIPHYLFHSQDPRIHMDVSGFLSRADHAVEKCLNQRQLPILVGGTGLYLRAWRFGIDDAPPSDLTVRRHLEQRLATEGVLKLHQELTQKDPRRASQIHPNDPVRVVRALEIEQITQKNPSTLLPGDFEKKPIQRIGHHVLIWPTLEWLRPRLEIRAKAMFNKALIKEVLALQNVLPEGSRLLKTMGYEEAALYLTGKITEDEAIKQMIKRQWAYARRQRTWFKKESWWNVYDAAAPDLLQDVVAGLEDFQ